eukprot:NODE_2641_length_1530_cov_52.619758_g2277_i0.p1 GENE.NODE_2641_length_1530_cov_52.619758_g2277_i0~~NODE_2641_length_1530_cov_52.619758_g2277_i0.p1  ORF type:complete len:430 (-),score=76.00 NODE_2641_length_1530_cov_52.619758_g2277_i0:239-1489(-)
MLFASCLFVLVVGIFGEIDPIQLIQNVYSIPNKTNAAELYRAFLRAGQDYNETKPGPLPSLKTWECGITRSATPPTSVHKLLPGDIDIVGALGDSLTAAFGAEATNPLTIASWKEVRGKSFSIGGSGDETEYITIANILKKANPALVGFSVGDTTLTNGPDDVANSQMNRARSGARADALLPVQYSGIYGESYNWTQVGRSLYGSDFNTKWKLLTLFIGSNNLCWACPCDDCNVTRHLASTIKAELIATLDYLKANSPRTLVSIVLPVDTSKVFNVKGSGLWCSTFLNSECPCGSSSNSEWRDIVTTRTNEYQAIMEDLQNSATYNTDDFAVVVQPFTKGVEPPKKTDGSYDMTYFAPDCFHFSAKAHAAAATALWDDMITGIGSKPETWWPGEALNCPSTTQFLCTAGNKGVGGC